MRNLVQTTLSRRHFLKTGLCATAGGLLVGCAGGKPAQAARKTTAAVSLPAGTLALPDLAYPYDALEPTIDALTMEIHHSRHHAAYTNNMTRALEAHPAYAAQPLEQLLQDIPALPAELQTTIRNNGGGHWNHDLFWRIMSPDGGGQPSGELAAAIDDAFGDFNTFKSQFNQAGLTRFGSGWAWLLVTENGGLAVSSTPNQDNPLMHGLVGKTGQPILGNDVWEHAYYLQYQNRRGDYLAAWWDVVNWAEVQSLYAAAVAATR